MTTTKTDYRALCKKLTDAYEHELNKRGMGCDLIARARAALAQPEPEGPTDKELLQIAATTIEPYASSGIAVGEYEAETECAVEAYGSELIAFARAAIAADRARLAQPEPERPTDKELCQILHQAICDFPPTHPDALNLDARQYEIALELHKARAVLARWGRPAIEPVPEGYSEGPLSEFNDGEIPLG